MGKNWKKGNYKAGGSGHQSNDFSSCRGHGVVIGTCDAARERETSKELVNLLSDAIEEVYAEEEKELRLKLQKKYEESNPQSETSTSKSIQDLLKQEIEVIKQKKHSVTQNVISINTGVKGIALAKINRREYCPLKLVQSIFDKVNRTKDTYCRHVVRLIPLQIVFFPNEEELNEHSKMMIFKSLNIPYEAPTKKREYLEDNSDEMENNKKPRLESDSEDLKEDTEEKVIEGQNLDEKADENQDSEPVVPNDKQENNELLELESNNEVNLIEEENSLKEQTITNSTEKFRYHVVFKARNHNVLTKDIVQRSILRVIYPYGKGDYRSPDVSFFSDILFFCFI